MADLTIIATSVLSGPGSQVREGVAGTTITAGDLVYLDPVTGKYLLSDNNGTPAASRTVDGIATNGAAINQPLHVHSKGPITIGATVAAGTAYYLSANAGKICVAGDLATGSNPVLIGLATSTTQITVKIQNSGVTLA